MLVAITAVILGVVLFWLYVKTLHRTYGLTPERSKKFEKLMDEEIKKFKEGN